MRASLTLVIAAFLLLAGSAQAGPPCVCDDVDIGDARSLPWGEDGRQRDRDYDRRKLVGDTLSILSESDSALVHAETLRRAALYADRDFGIEARLMLALMTRAMDDARQEKRDPMTWFDAGYLAEILKELGSEIRADGYGWMRRSQALGLDDPGVDLACAFIASIDGPEGRKRAEGHVRRILARPDDGENALVRANLRKWGKRSGHPLATVVKKVEAEQAPK